MLYGQNMNSKTQYLFFFLLEWWIDMSTTQPLTWSATQPPSAPAALDQGVLSGTAGPTAGNAGPPTGCGSSQPGGDRQRPAGFGCNGLSGTRRRRFQPHRPNTRSASAGRRLRLSDRRRTRASCSTAPPSAEPPTPFNGH